MRIRILVADSGEARFYDTDESGEALRAVGRVSDPEARLHDRDLKSDRPGRVFDHAPAAGRRRGAVGHHGTGGERRPHKVLAQRFAHRIAGELARALHDNEFDRLVVMAGPPFLGALRKAWPEEVRSTIAGEVGKDLLHASESAVREHLPRELFSPVASSGS